MFMDRRLFTDEQVEYYLYDTEGVVGIVDISQAMYVTKDGDMVPALGDVFSQLSFLFDSE